MMLTAFLENARLLRELDILPLLYGSLGLELATGLPLSPDDIDILIPGTFLEEGWPAFRSFLEHRGYVLTDLHEHTFRKEGMEFSYARLEELEGFAGIPVAQIRTVSREGISFRLLQPEQYLKVYTASAKDGYRKTVKNKKDEEKIALLRQLLRDPTHPS